MKARAEARVATAKPLAELRPRLPGWVEMPPPAHGRGVRALSAWRRDNGVFVLSSLDEAELPDRSGVGLQWHVSVSRGGERPGPKDVRAALRAFGMVGAEEDNHHPGAARHFWLPVDAAHRVDCECKEDERLVVEADGYRWTTPHEGPCRGCELQRTLGRPCPLHGGKAVSR